MTFLIIGMIFFLVWHQIWVTQNNRLDAKLVALKNQNDFHQSLEMTQDSELLREAHNKQKIFWHWFGLLDCLSHHRIQLIKIEYQMAPIFLAGRVASMLDLSSALAICHFPTNINISTIPLQHSDFLQFSIRIFA